MTNKSVNSLFGKRLKALRLEKGLTPLQFYERTSIDKETLDRYEAGEIEPILTTMVSMAKALDISLMELMNFHIED